MRRSLAVLLALTVVVTATGCSPSGQAPPDPSASSDATATTLDSIEIGSTGIELAFGDGATESFAYSDKPAGVVSALTASFGAEPRVTAEAGDECNAESTTWRWGDFAVSSNSSVSSAHFSVTARGPSAGDVALTTDADVAVDDSVVELASTLPETQVESFASPDGIITYVSWDPHDVTGTPRAVRPGWGLELYAENDIIQFVSSPVVYGLADSC
jgi:hypothetical protein